MEKCEEVGCPKCKARSYLVQTYTLFLTLANWQLMFIIGGSIIVCGGILEIGHFDTAMFALLAILPFLAGIRRKKLCLQCRIEFEPADLVSEPPVS